MSTIRARVVALSGAVALTAAAAVAVAVPAQAVSASGKVGFCHSTGSTTHPYVFQSTSGTNILSWDDHSGMTNGKHWYDLISAFADFNGQYHLNGSIDSTLCPVADAAAAATFALGGSADAAAQAAAQAVNAASPSAVTADPSAALATASADATAAATTATPSATTAGATATPSAVTATPSAVVVTYGSATNGSTGLFAF
ncbi:hypothetical protein QDR37_00495 [Amnibacterium sp. CER49]|uniref:hypothetical protein n=1 Tax=Amnibacterium sp. CER49 TaxID=3039161 RepID=UPI00244BEAA5|nr:hypothetical protein [Amnibacterium sp. CER49]MDH2442415.1 hypothetical protein [Amnibacterium sp. CER49]